VLLPPLLVHLAKLKLRSKMVLDPPGLLERINAALPPTVRRGAARRLCVVLVLSLSVLGAPSSEPSA
jgi:hypothetical protein